MNHHAFSMHYKRTVHYGNTDQSRLRITKGIHLVALVVRVADPDPGVFQGFDPDPVFLRQYPDPDR